MATLSRVSTLSLRRLGKKPRKWNSPDGIPETASAAVMAEGEGYDIEVIDLVSLVPYDLATVLRSVEKTGRLVVAQEAPRTCGFAAELIAEVGERAFTRLEAPPARVTGFDTPFPYSLEDHYLPGAERLLDALVRAVEY